MALAGDEHHVTGTRRLDRERDGALPIELDDVAALRRGHFLRREAREARGANAFLDGRCDGLGRFGARVVARDDRDVGARAHRLAHRRALGRVAIAAAAEDADDAAHLSPPTAAARPRDGVEHARERVRRVRVVDEHDDVVACAVASLEAPGAPISVASAAAARSTSRSSALATPIATSRFSRLCSPTSRVSISTSPPGTRATMRMPFARASTESGAMSASSARAVRAELRAHAQHLALRGGRELRAERVVDVDDREARARSVVKSAIFAAA